MIVTINNTYYSGSLDKKTCFLLVITSIAHIKYKISERIYSAYDICITQLPHRDKIL